MSKAFPMAIFLYLREIQEFSNIAFIHCCFDCISPYQNYYYYFKIFHIILSELCALLWHCINAGVIISCILMNKITTHGAPRFQLLWRP